MSFRNRFRVRGPLVLAYIGAVGFLTGCGDSGSTLARTIPLDSIELGANQYPVGKEWRQRYTWAEHGELDRLSFELWQNGISACMTARGFDYQVVPFFDVNDLFTAINPLNLATAQVYGYHTPQNIESGLEQSDHSQSFDAVLNGSGSNPAGCASLASAYAYGFPNFERWTTEQDAISSEVGALLADDATSEPSTKYLAAWSACMRTRGYDYANPEAPLGEFSDDATVSPTELATRMADLDCDRDVGLTQSRSNREQELVSRWESANALRAHDLEILTDQVQREVATRTEQLRSQGVAVLGG